MSTVLEPDHWMKLKYELDLYILIASFSKYMIFVMTQFYVCTGGCFPHSRRGCTGWTPLRSTCSWWTLCPSMTSATDTLFTGILSLSLHCIQARVYFVVPLPHFLYLKPQRRSLYLKIVLLFTLTQFLLNIWSISEKRDWILREIEE